MQNSSNSSVPNWIFVQTEVAKGNSCFIAFTLKQIKILKVELVFSRDFKGTIARPGLSGELTFSTFCLFNGCTDPGLICQAPR